ncbi:MAG: hypothetical protein ACKPKO_39830, partial [Candidatus Fonsibacter sp.]
ASVAYGLMYYATEASYEVYHRARSSPQVLSTVQTGFVGCVMLNPRNPKDVLRWLTECHNSFHSGPRTIILEVLQESSRIEVLRGAFRQANGITSQGCGRGENTYERQYFTYIPDKFPGRFKT